MPNPEPSESPWHQATARVRGVVPARLRASCALIAITFASGGVADAQQTADDPAPTPATPCDMAFATAPSADPAVRNVRITRATATPDATVSLRLDGPATSYTYMLSHVAIDAANARATGRSTRFASRTIAVAVPADAGIVDGVVGVLDDGPSHAPACAPSRVVGDGSATRGVPAPVVASVPAHSPAQPSPEAAVAVAVPTLGQLTPLQCAKPFQETAVVGRPAEPEYPDAARLHGETGFVEVLLDVHPDGTAHDAVIETSSRWHDLDISAVTAALRTTYVPETFRCVPTMGTYMFTVRYSDRPF